MLKTTFNGERLKSARLYRGLTIADLSDKLGISKQMVSRYENNKNSPSAEMMFEIEKLLEFPRKYFYEFDDEKIQMGNTYFRSLVSTSKRDQDIQNIRLLYLSKIYRLLSEYIVFPKLNLPTINETDVEDVEKVARALRNHWELGQLPVGNMVRLLEANGIIVTSNKTNIASIDAFTQCQRIGNDSYYIVVLGQDKGNAYRRQFDAAHELGHVLIHDSYADLDEIDKDERRKMEKEANQFASAFLLPKEEFSRDVMMHPSDIDHYVYLKKKWNVSISAMVVRAFNLELITFNQYHNLQRIISHRNWRKHEIFDSEVAPSKPVLLKKAVMMLLDNKKLSGPELLNVLAQVFNLSISSNEFEDLTGLERGTLLKYRTEQSAIVIDFKK